MALKPDKNDPNIKREEERKRAFPSEWGDFRMQDQLDAKMLGKTPEPASKSADAKLPETASAGGK